MYLNICPDMREQLLRWIWCQEMIKNGVLLAIDCLDQLFNVVIIPLSLRFISNGFQALLYDGMELFYGFLITPLNA